MVRFDYGKPHALVTFAYANPTTPTEEGDPFDVAHKALGETAKAHGWYWTAGEIVDPRRDAPPENGEKVIEALDALIKHAQDLRDHAMCFTELTADDIFGGDLDGLARAVDQAIYALPDPEDDDDDA